MSDPSPHTAEVQRLQAEVARLAAERAQLAQALEYHERDRQLLAFEIHDGIVQDMAAATMFFDAAGAHAVFASPADREAFDKGLHTLRGAVQEARRMIQGLIPVTLDERGVAASLEHLITRFRQDHGLVIDYSVLASDLRLPPPIEMTVLRIVQEALNNVWKHSQSPKAEVRLEQRPDSLVVSVEDWGVGFDPEQAHKTRYGLVGVKERARLFGGLATIQSAPGQGALVQVELPIPARDDAQAWRTFPS